VVGVEDVAGALAALALKPDLITLDLELPDGRGREVLEALRKHSFCPFVIVISGAGSASEAFALRARGVAVYLEKPWARNELSRILVEGHRSHLPTRVGSTTGVSRVGTCVTGVVRSCPISFRRVDSVTPTIQNRRTACGGAVSCALNLRHGTPLHATSAAWRFVFGFRELPMTLTSPHPRTVVDVFEPFGMSNELRQWAVSMGSDFRRAWKECPHGIWLIYVARALDAPSARLVQLEFAAMGESAKTLKALVQSEAADIDMSSPDAIADLARRAIPSPQAVDARLAALIRETWSIDELLAGRS
jgi:CheY-like chemotaxis protein